MLGRNSHNPRQSDVTPFFTTIGRTTRTRQLAMRKAQQAARGNVTDIMESLQDQAGSLGERNVVDVERADAQLEVSRKTHELLERQGKEVAEREIVRDRKTEEFRKQQMAAEAARDQKQDVQVIVVSCTIIRRQRCPDTPPSLPESPPIAWSQIDFSQQIL